MCSSVMAVSGGSGRGGSGLAGTRRAHRDRRARSQRPRQVVFADQRVVLVGTLRAVGRRQHRRPDPAEQQPDLQRRLQMRQQCRRVRAVPAPPIRRRRPRRRRIRHQRLVPQQVLVQVREATAAHRTRRCRTLHRARQRVVPARIQDQEPQRRARCRYQQVVDCDRLEAHVDVRAQASRRPAPGS